GEAEQRSMHIGSLTGGQRRIQDASQETASAGEVPLHEAGEPQVLLHAGGKVLVAVRIGDPERFLKVRQGSLYLASQELGDAKVGRREGEHIVIPARRRKSEDLLLVSQGCVQVTRLALKHRAVAESGGKQMGLPGCPGQRDGLVSPGKR